jgi:hypothetical protein
MYNSIVALLSIWACSMPLVHLTPSFRQTSGTRSGARTTDPNQKE